MPDHNDTISYAVSGRLYLNITNRCSADCTFCVRKVSDGVYGYNLRLSEEPSEARIFEELEAMTGQTKFEEVVFTGFGEPTYRFDTLLLITKWLKDRGIPVRLDTNGHASLINPGRDVIGELKAAGLDAVSVSLNAESEERYNLLCRPKLAGSYGAMLTFTGHAVAAGMEARMTVVGTQDADIWECKRIAHGLGALFAVR